MVRLADSNSGISEAWIGIFFVLIIAEIIAVLSQPLYLK